MSPTFQLSDKEEKLMFTHLEFKSNTIPNLVHLTHCEPDSLCV